MPSMLDKCHVLNVHRQENCSFPGSEISNVTQEMDIGVIITTDLKSSAPCRAAEQKAQKILGYIKRVFRCRNKRTVLGLFGELIRLLLEYGAKYWFQIKRVEVEHLEKVQARGTKLFTSLRHKGYQRRLADLGLFTLEHRRLRGLLIETVWIVRGFSGMYPVSVFELPANRKQTTVLS